MNAPVPRDHCRDMTFAEAVTPLLLLHAPTLRYVTRPGDHLIAVRLYLLARHAWIIRMVAAGWFARKIAPVPARLRAMVPNHNAAIPMKSLVRRQRR